MDDSSESALVRRSQRAQLSGLLALAISIIALGLTAYQTRLMQQQARASVWPYISIGASYFDRGEEAGFAFSLYNNGIGPAHLESVVIRVDGQPVTSWNAVIQALAPGAKNFGATYSAINGRVLPPDSNRDTAIRALRVDDPLGHKLFLGLSRLDAEVCYCSVYDDCWVKRFLSENVKPVAHCMRHGNDEFRDTDS